MCTTMDQTQRISHVVFLRVPCFALCYFYLIQKFYSCVRLLYVLFANDTNIFMTDKGINNIIQAMHIELNQLSIWLNTNKLTLNISKAHFMAERKMCRINRLMIRLIIMSLNKWNTRVLNMYIYIWYYRLCYLYIFICCIHFFQTV